MTNEEIDKMLIDDWIEIEGQETKTYLLNRNLHSIAIMLAEIVKRMPEPPKEKVNYNRNDL